jgi:acyl-coenzyme A thioesterase PaaI-like protein
MVQARGRIDRRGRGLAHLSATVHDGDRLAATAQVVKALSPPARRR